MRWYMPPCSTLQCWVFVYSVFVLCIVVLMYSIKTMFQKQLAQTVEAHEDDVRKMKDRFRQQQREMLDQVDQLKRKKSALEKGLKAAELARNATLQDLQVFLIRLFCLVFRFVCCLRMFWNTKVFSLVIDVVFNRGTGGGVEWVGIERKVRLKEGSRRLNWQEILRCEICRFVMPKIEGFVCRVDVTNQSDFFTDRAMVWWARLFRPFVFLILQKTCCVSVYSDTRRKKIPALARRTPP